MKNGWLIKAVLVVSVFLLLQAALVLIGQPALLLNILLWIWFKAEQDVFAEFVMKSFSVIGVLWFARLAILRASYFAEHNINYDEVRVQLIHFCDGLFFIETLQGSGTKLGEVLHNEAYQKTVHQMLKTEDGDSVLPLWEHRWGNSIVGAIAEFVNAHNHDANAEAKGYYIVPCVIRTEQHTTCLTLNIMERDTLEQLQVLKKLHSAKVLETSHMDRLVVAHRAAALFLHQTDDVYLSDEERAFRKYTARCFRALRIGRDPKPLLAAIQAEKKQRGEPTEITIDWQAAEVVATLRTSTMHGASSAAQTQQLRQLQVAAAAASGS